MSSDYEKLKKLYDQIDRLTVMDIASNEFIDEFVVWNSSCMSFFEDKYGENSAKYANYKALITMLPDEQNPNYLKNRSKMQTRVLPLIKKFFGSLLGELKENEAMTDNDNKNVFIVHGHADDLKYQISDLLRTIKLNPIILHKKTSSSRAIIEKIEKYGREASTAVVLFTPDDFGNVKTEEEKKPRARQNVVFEAGYFMGLLGRDRVILVVSDKSIELPGDLTGVVYSETSELDIAKELKAMGLDVDLNDLM